MIAQELFEYLQTLAGDWKYPPNTVDTFKSGQPDWEVSGIAVAWMSYRWALQRALELGCNTFITHEPTYYDHFDNNPAMLDIPQVRAKRDWIEQNKLIIIRCHDLWDQMPKTGITDAWGEFLGLTKVVSGDAFVRVYEIRPRPARLLAAQVASKTGKVGQPFVQLIGSGETLVERICIGTGAITPFLNAVEQYRVDLAICTDDGIDYWRDGAFAIDMNIPIIVINHPVSEEAGVIRLAAHIQAKYPHIPVHHIPQGCMYQLIGGE